MGNIDTVGNITFHYGMCAYCNLDTAGQHEPDCLLAKPQIVFVPFGERYPDFVKRQKKLIDDRPERGIEYL